MLSGYLALISAVGCLAVFLSGRFPIIPIVVGEIGGGILVGSAVLAFLPPPDAHTAGTLADLTDLGFLFLMFLVGTHLPLKTPGLSSAVKQSSIATVACFALSAVVSYLVLARYTNLSQPLIFMLLLANTSAAVVEPMVHDKKLEGPIVLVTRVWGMMADTITILAVPLALAPNKLANASAGSVVVFFMAAAALFGLKWFRNSAAGAYLRERSKRLGHALDFRMSLTILFTLSFVAHYEFGISNLIAGFAAGAVAALIGEPRRFNKQLIGTAEGLFITIFFVMLGAQLNFGQLFHSPENLELAGAIALSTTLVHLVVAKGVRLPLASGFTVSAQLGLPAAVASLGLQNGMLDSVQAAALVAGSLLSIGVSSLGIYMLQRYSVPDPEGSEHAVLPADHAYPGHDG